MAFNMSTTIGSGQQINRLANAWGKNCEIAIGFGVFASGIATITVTNLARVDGAIIMEQVAATGHIIFVTATSGNTFSVLAEATSGGGAAAISTGFAWLAWGLPRM